MSKELNIHRGGKKITYRKPIKKEPVKVEEKEKEPEKQIIDRKNIQNEQKETPKTSKPPNKKPYIALFLAITAFCCWYYIDYIDFYFLSLLRLSIACFEQDLPEYGIIVFIIQFLAWLAFATFFYFGVFNMVYPRIRGVNAMRTKNTYARKVLQVEGPDPDYVYVKVKFTLLPIFDWYTMKIPKPTKDNGVKWRRMPQSIDIQSEDINLIYNETEHLYEITNKNIERIQDEQQYYKNKTTKIIKYIGENIGSAIQGDSNMMKDYYTMSLVMDENNEPIPKQMLKRPPQELEKEINKRDENDG